ncbi:type VI secretion system ATPase TssH [Chromobacterium phragmitis]|uniref:type VI secretion system ATPase TssH n=1 Tax=Chromobacterium amazonense TaxID=1382803 RepID=UPI0021B7280B|nr:type VI secretion system ATPase TssH [Chromobacterium amazonense]MBM2886775.1 type VI secretion system ATPase TssH [Chromobacterium amazonense]MDE1715850.1 type VI secretion system ATPase TssH [Chromobacterium amazonense]
MSAELAQLVSRLNPGCRKALERAAQRCLQQSHYYVEIEHVLLELLDMPDGDLPLLLPKLGLSPDQLSAELRRSLDQFKRGETRAPAFSSHTVAWLKEALLLATLRQEASIRSGLLLLTLLERDELRNLLLIGAPCLLRAPRQPLLEQLDAWAAVSREAPSAAAAEPASALARFTHDLVADARAGRIDPIVGRDGEIRQCLDILLRRRQNNPILVGAPGVGKTAVAEGLALRIAHEEVPPALAGVGLLALDLGLLQAGAGLKGEFEQRLNGVMDEVRASPRPIILFIDEAHTLVGAGAAEGHSDAANLLKPALARGELRTVAATTWQEYKKYFERDPALARRFQPVQVEEPDEDSAVAMLRGVAARLEQHHGVRILDAAIHDAVKLSHRYISGRQLPDKAISVLDTACARVALAQHEQPPQLENLRRSQAMLDEELERLLNEQATGLDHAARIAALRRDRAEHAAAMRELSARWQDELNAVREILRVRQQLQTALPAGEPPLLLLEEDEAEDGDDAAPATRLAEQLARLEAGLDALRQDDPLVPEHVDSKAVAAVIAGWTGIPVGKMLADEAYAIRTLAQRMGQRVIGQPAALGKIAQRIQAYRAGLTDPGKPVGVFLLLGPTGVGKTETAYALADALYGGERNLIVVNLAEYQEAHSVSQLKGAPPGYVGYGQGGVLTEAVRRKPYSVVLLDEIEKAHPDVLEAFYNVFDKGQMEDGTGLMVDFNNTIILATSNVGAELLQTTPGEQLATQLFDERLRKTLLQTFRPAFLARMTVVPYPPLAERTLENIVINKLEKLQARYKAATGKQFDFDPAIVKAVLAKCSSAGARDIENVLMEQVTGKLAEWVLE